ncbi:adenylyl-sulfate kinase [Actinosynnema sp. CS-041913]|uniref:adenylyl-sulfate kinase n=1 Tax=Actinosynnema sp. CS-041913 TaxID=3239917 RepID=UPI003D9294F1
MVVDTAFDKGVTVWLTGLPSAGKSSIAQEAGKVLLRRGVRVQVLDGDEIRGHLCADLGFSRADRDTNVRRVGFVAELLARNGIVVLVPVIAPYRDSRAAVRALHEGSGTPYVEAFVDTPLALCAQRDVKGLYARQRTGRMTGLTGVDDPYEAPEQPEIRITTADRDVTGSALDLVVAIGQFMAGRVARKFAPTGTHPTT